MNTPAQVPVIYTAPTHVTAPGATNDDCHRRRDGEPLGYVPQVGDIIRYALRHGPWDSTGARLADWPARDAQGAWSTPHIVEGRWEEEAGPRYRLRDKTKTGERSWIDLDWWICEHVILDGALW